MGRSEITRETLRTAIDEGIQAAVAAMVEGESFGEREMARLRKVADETSVIATGSYGVLASDGREVSCPLLRAFPDYDFAVQWGEAFEIAFDRAMRAAGLTHEDVVRVLP